MNPQTRYVTVDLVMKGNGSTDKLSASLDSMSYYVQKHDWNDDNKWYLNISCPCDFENADLCIQKYCDDLSNLSEEAKTEWDEAAYREFDVGYHVGIEPAHFVNHLSQSTILKSANLNAGIGITLYSHSDNEE